MLNRKLIEIVQICEVIVLNSKERERKRLCRQKEKAKAEISEGSVSLSPEVAEYFHQ